MQKHNTQNLSQSNPSATHHSRAHTSRVLPVPDPTQPILTIIQRYLTKPQSENFTLLLLAVLIGRTFRVHCVATFLLCSILQSSCHKRLQRFLSQQKPVPTPFKRAWLRTMLTLFAPGRARVPLLIDWTMHKDLCKSLWIALPIGGRAVPLAVFLAPIKLQGKHSQRAFEDEAIRQVKAWLPKRREFVLVADRGFFSIDRLQFLQSLALSFVIRMRSNTSLEIEGTWYSIPQLTPQAGRLWKRKNVPIGKTTRGKLKLNIVAVCHPLPKAKPVKDWKGHKTNKTQHETAWFLVTDLPLCADLIGLYSWRMQIEQTFRDFKSVLGLENAQMRHPEKRMEWLVWAMLVSWVLCVALEADELSFAPQTTMAEFTEIPCPASLCPAPSCPGPRSLAPKIRRIAARTADKHEMPAPLLTPSVYRQRSAFREGTHRFLLRLFTAQTGLVQLIFNSIDKSQKMKNRPQVQNRRTKVPPLVSRTTTRLRQNTT